MPTDVTLTATFEILGQTFTATKDSQVYSATFDSDFTLGQIVTDLLRLVDRNRALTLDAPWDVLNNIDIGKPTIKLDVGPQKRIGLSMSLATGTKAGDLLKLDQIDVWYWRDTKRHLSFEFQGEFLGVHFDQDHPLTWDVLNQPPPAAPAKGPSKFQLDYLALGQHFQVDPNAATTLHGVLGKLEHLASPTADQSRPDPTLLTFAPDSNWLIGARFTVLDTVTLGLIFNDPSLYGVSVALNGKRAKSLAGLRFEILYRRISDGLGVYHTELKLPDQYRHIDVGEAAVTLPIIDLDVYTNGNFLIDFGFPWNHDFSRAATFSVIVLGIPVQGAFGFYFGVLDSQTAPSSVPAITNGVFDPVIVFGVGVQVGIGKEFDKGPLHAGFFIGIEAILEGVLAFFHPNDSRAEQATYFKVKGTVIIIGHIFGSIDFSVIKARVDVLFQITASVEFEIYKQVTLHIDAEVSISLSLTVLGFEVDLSFHAEVSETAVFGSDQPTPWLLAA